VIPLLHTAISERFADKCKNIPLLANVKSRSTSLYVVVRPFVCRLSSVTFVRPTQGIEIFGNVSTPFGTLAICELSVKILRRSSHGNPSVEGGGGKTEER